MTELKKIQAELTKHGRKAYQKAKNENNAYIVIGNSIYRVQADGNREKMETISQTRVKTRQKKFTL